MKRISFRHQSGFWAGMAMAAVILIVSPGQAEARDRGVNQPGVAGNAGPVGPDRDPGINQPGAVGNVGAPGVGRDPGINQPGAAGNRGRVYR